MKDIANRLSRIEQTVDGRMRALMTPDDELIRRRVNIRRMLDYLGLPHADDDGLASQRQSETRYAQIMLSTGCTKEMAIVKECAERYGVTEDAAREWLRGMVDAGKLADGDMDSGKPFGESEAGARYREMLVSGPKAGIEP